MIIRLFLVATLSLFVFGCAPGKKENVVIPQKNPDSEKVEEQKGADEGRNPWGQQGPARGERQR